MKKFLGLIIGAAALVALIIAASVLYKDLGGKYRPDQLVTDAPSTANTAADTTAPEEQADLAPDFTVTDWEGDEVKLSDFRGKPVVLNFWASWCPPCKSEMPDFDAAYKTHGGSVQFMMVNCTDGSSETVGTAKAFIESTDYTFPVFFDTSYEASMKYGTSSIPMTFFINADGELVTYARGMLDAESLERGIGMIAE